MTALWHCNPPISYCNPQPLFQKRNCQTAQNVVLLPHPRAVGKGHTLHLHRYREIYVQDPPAPHIHAHTEKDSATTWTQPLQAAGQRNCFARQGHSLLLRPEKQGTSAQVRWPFPLTELLPRPQQLRQPD